MVSSTNTSDFRMASPVPSENRTRSEGMFISATNENDARMACIARLETFTKCSADKFIHAKPADLAAAGFEYILGVDLFRCSSCGVEIRDWKEGEEPLEVHRNRSRNCRFLQENFMNSASYSDAVASVGGASLLTDSEEASSATAGAAARLSEIQIENKKLRERITCKECGVEKVQTLFLPCRHLAVCEHCAERLDNCCVCHGKILGTVRVVMVPKIP